MNGVLRTGLGVLDKQISKFELDSDFLREASSTVHINTELQSITGINEGSYDTINIEGYSALNTYTVSSKIGGNVSIQGNKIIMDYSNVDITENIDEVITLGVIEPGKFLNTREYSFTIFHVPIVADEAISNADFAINESFNDGFRY